MAGRSFAFLPVERSYAHEGLNSPYVAFKALEYKFFTGGKSLVDSYSRDYSMVETNAEEEDRKNLEAIKKQLSDLSPDSADAQAQVEQIQAEVESLLKNSEQSRSDSYSDLESDNSVDKGKKTKKILHTIFLPVQGGMIQSLQNNWGGANNYRLGLGVNFSDIKATARSMVAFTKRYLITEVINSALKDLWKMGLHSQGQAFNEYVGMVYTSPDFRTHRFSFDLYPSTKEEADILRRIIFAFKYYASPASDVGLSITYPAMWEIDIVAPDFSKPNGNTGKRLMMVYYSALRNIVVNHEVDGTVIFHEDGEPSKNHIELEFVELNYLTRDLMNVEASVMFGGKSVSDVLDNK